MEIPARISVEKSDEIRKLALKAFEALACEGMARVDFFLTTAWLNWPWNAVIQSATRRPGFRKLRFMAGQTSLGGLRFDGQL